MFSLAGTVGSLSLPRALFCGVTSFGCACAIAQSTVFGLVKSIGMKVVEVAIVGGETGPQERGRGGKIGSRVLPLFTRAKICFLQKKKTTPPFFTKQPFAPAVILKCPTET